MAGNECEYRLSDVEAGINAGKNVHGEPAPQGAIVVLANQEHLELCQILIDRIDPLPKCQYPKCNGTNCPLVNESAGQ